MGAHLAPPSPPTVRAAQLSAAVPLHPARSAVRLRRCSPAPLREPEGRPWSRRGPSSPSPWDKSPCCALQPSPQGAHLHGGGLRSSFTPGERGHPEATPRSARRAAAAACLRSERDSRARAQISPGSLTLPARGVRAAATAETRGARSSRRHRAISAASPASESIASTAADFSPWLREAGGSGPGGRGASGPGSAGALAQHAEPPVAGAKIVAPELAKRRMTHPRSQPAGRRGRTAVAAGGPPVPRPPGSGGAGDRERLPGRREGSTGHGGKGPGPQPPAPPCPPGTAPSTPLLRSPHAPCGVRLRRCPEIIWQQSGAGAASTHRST